MSTNKLGNINNFVLKAKIESSKSNEKVEGSIIKELAQSKKLLGEVKRSGNIELYNKMLKEHNKLKATILKSLEGDKKFSIKERKKIMLDFTNTIYLSKGKGKISNTNKVIAYFSYGLNAATSIFSGEEELEGYKTKDIVNLNKTELNLLQENLIKEYLGTENNYNDKYLKGFNNQKGNYIIEISKFKEEIQNKEITKIDSITLASYLEYLSSKGTLNINSLKKYFGEKKLKELGDLWKNNKGETITQKLLKEAGIEEIIENIISFSDIIKDPINTIPKLKTIPTKEEIRKTPLKEIIKFNRDFKGACPVFDKENANSSMEKFNKILEKSKSIEIEEYGKENFLKQFDKVIEKRIENSKFSKKEIEQLKQKSKLKANEVYQKGLDILKNPDQACGFELTIYIRNEIDDFLSKNKLNKLDEKERKELSGIVAETHLKQSEKKLTSVTDKIEILEKKKKKTKEDKKIIIKLKEKQKQLKEKVKKANKIYETTQASDDELERYINIINNGGTKEEAYKDFKNNKLQENNTIDLETNYYETKIIKYKNGEELVYVETPEGYNIDNGKGENTGIDITKQEFESIKDKPENLKNLLKFKESLSELNLDFIWEKRLEFIKKLGNIEPTLNIKIDKTNYINNTELKKILNAIITLSGEEKSQLNSLSSIKSKLREISNSGLDETKKDNIGSPIEKIFIKKGIIDKNSSINYFNINKMKENYK